MSIADALSQIQVQNHLRLVHDFAARFSRASLFIWSIWSLANAGVNLRLVIHQSRETELTQFFLHSRYARK